MIKKEQYKYLFEYTGRHYSRYYDVQLEVIDHLASLIEDIRIQDPTIGFKSALNIAYKSMPGREFEKVTKEKEKAMRKYWNKHIVRFLLNYLRWPLIVKTLMYSCIIYTFLIFFGSYLSFGVGLILLFLFGLYEHFNIKSLQKKQGQFLAIKIYLGVTSSLWIVPLSILFCQMEALKNFTSFEFTWQIFIAVVIAFILLLQYGLSVHFPDFIRENIVSKYEALVPTTI